MADEIATERYPTVIRLKSENEAETVHYSILHEGLPDEFQCIAQKELDETDEKREKGMQRLRELVKRENFESLNDNYILAVLRSCKYNYKKSEAKLKKFLSVYEDTVAKIANLDLEKAEKILDDMCLGVVPYRDKHGSIVMYTWPNGLRQDEYTLDDVAACSLATVLFLMTFPISTVAGFSYLGDGEMPSMTLFYNIFKRFLVHVPTFISFPIRVRRVDMLNTIPVFHWGFRIISTLMPNKISKRVALHTAGYDSIHQMYDPKILPEHFGGSLGPNSSHLYKDRLLEFLKELKVKHNRSISSNI